MGDVGIAELAVIAFVAVLVFGPDKLPALAKQAAALIHAARKVARSARDDLRSELGPEYADLELHDLDPRAIVRRHVMEAMADLEDERTTDMDSMQRALEPGEAPPYDSEAT